MKNFEVISEKNSRKGMLLTGVHLISKKGTQWFRGTLEWDNKLVFISGDGHPPVGQPATFCIARVQGVTHWNYVG